MACSSLLRMVCEDTWQLAPLTGVVAENSLGLEPIAITLFASSRTDIRGLAALAEP